MNDLQEFRPQAIEALEQMKVLSNPHARINAGAPEDLNRGMTNEKVGKSTCRCMLDFSCILFGSTHSAIHILLQGFIKLGMSLEKNNETLIAIFNPPTVTCMLLDSTV